MIWVRAIRFIRRTKVYHFIKGHSRLLKSKIQYTHKTAARSRISMSHRNSKIKMRHLTVALTISNCQHVPWLPKWVRLGLGYAYLQNYYCKFI